MNIEVFIEHLLHTNHQRASHLAPALAGLWWDRKGDWMRAHESAQQDEGPEGSWVHAYLHRKEGDQGNTSAAPSLRDRNTSPFYCRSAPSGTFEF
jgi:hypothetical protein